VAKSNKFKQPVLKLYSDDLVRPILFFSSVRLELAAASGTKHGVFVVSISIALEEAKAKDLEEANGRFNFCGTAIILEFMSLWLGWLIETPGNER